MTRLLLIYAVVKGILIALSGAPIPSFRNAAGAIYEGDEARRAMRQVELNHEWWVRECRAGRRSWEEFPYAY